MSRPASGPVNRALKAAAHMAASTSNAGLRIGMAAHVIALAEEVHRLRDTIAIRDARGKRSELIRYRQALPELIGCAGGDFKTCNRNHGGCCERRRHAAGSGLIAPIAEAAE